MARRNLIVEGQYLLHCAPPGEHNLYGSIEALINFRGPLKQLDESSRKTIKKRGLRGNNLVWLQASGTTRSAPGTPLFNTDNELAAINSFSYENAGKYSSCFVPVEQVFEMINQSDGELKPISDLGNGKGSLVVSVAENNPFREKVVELNQVAKSCADFDWIPKSREQYQDFQVFAERYIEIEAEARRLSGSTIAEEQKIIALQDDLEATLRERFTGLSLADEKLLGKMNADFAETELQRLNRFVPFYGEVLQPTIGNPQLNILVYNTTLETPVPYRAIAQPPKLESRWLFFAKTKTSRGSRRIESMLMVR